MFLMPLSARCTTYVFLSILRHQTFASLLPDKSGVQRGPCTAISYTRGLKHAARGPHAALALILF
jgi:hypothetical protein